MNDVKLRLRPKYRINVEAPTDESYSKLISIIAETSSRVVSYEGKAFYEFNHGPVEQKSSFVRANPITRRIDLTDIIDPVIWDALKHELTREKLEQEK